MCAAAALLSFPAASGAAAGVATAFSRTACPPAVAASADCSQARDENGAWLLVAMPRHWNRRLLVHAHGGPRLGEPRAGDSAEDLERFAVLVRAGYAWIGSTYRRGGYGVRLAAADVDNSRRRFWAQWGRPERTVLHGQSWGGNVAAKAAELYALDADGRADYDAVLITNGVLSGGTRAYGFRADLRAIYQYYCRNHPAPGEDVYPLWQGLPAAARMDRDELRRRVQDCTGLDSAPAQRTPEQASRLRDILAVSGVAERELLAHLAWGTFHFRDLVQKRLGGRNPFDNTQTRYRGSRDDVALNAGIERFSADPQAQAQLAYDADLSGLIVLPTLTVHALHDPVVSAAADGDYAATVAAAGRSRLLAQVATDEYEHSRLKDATYLGALQALDAWLDGGVRPDAAALQRRCLASAPDAADCRFVTP
ncbi:hypothetical protein [Tahibacter caeni]|uniref:hypothetical protein n=1 Tax=Tahibacter caeni TaxID=1453545 RepID=UPI002147690A|nr:hypothetical protein [Tahibacter caeni]